MFVIFIVSLFVVTVSSRGRNFAELLLGPVSSSCQQMSCCPGRFPPFERCGGYSQDLHHSKCSRSCKLSNFIPSLIFYWTRVQTLRCVAVKKTIWAFKPGKKQKRGDTNKQSYCIKDDSHYVLSTKVSQVCRKQLSSGLGNLQEGEQVGDQLGEEEPTQRFCRQTVARLEEKQLFCPTDLNCTLCTTLPEHALLRCHLINTTLGRSLQNMLSQKQGKSGQKTCLLVERDLPLDISNNMLKQSA